jgi:HlyD family secretion protein
MPKPEETMAKRWWILILFLVVAAGAVGWRVFRSRGREAGYRTDVVRRGDIKVQVSATGTLNAVTTVQVGSQVSGSLAALYADYNDKVHQGQVLAQLDPTFLRAQVEQSRADLNKTEVQVRQALRDSARVFPLGAEGLASKADVDASQTALDAARASAASAQAALERAQTNLRYATITSPIDGVVISRDVSVGQTVAASLSAPTLYTIAQDLTHMQLEAAVDEADIGQVRVGQPASFTVDAYPDFSFRGVVHQIRLAPETVQNVVTYTVVIYVDNPEEKLLPGMTANVTILVNEARDVLMVPSMALRFRPASEAGGRGGSASGGALAAGGAGGATGGGGTTGGGGAQGETASGGFRGAGVAGGGTGQSGAGQSGTGQSSAGQGGGRGFRGGSGGGGGYRGEGEGGGGSRTAGGTGAQGPGGRLGPQGESVRPAGGTLYLLGPRNRLHKTRVRAGISDGTFTAVFSDSIREGEPVVVGMDLASGKATEQNVVNPFAPRMGGGGGGGRR